MIFSPFYQDVYVEYTIEIETVYDLLFWSEECSYASEILYVFWFDNLNRTDMYGVGDFFEGSAFFHGFPYKIDDILFIEVKR